MALMAILVGSCLGFISAIFGVAFGDLSFGQAFALYLALGVGTGCLAILRAALGDEGATPHAG